MITLKNLETLLLQDIELKQWSTSLQEHREYMKTLTPSIESSPKPYTNTDWEFITPKSKKTLPYEICTTSTSEIISISSKVRENNFHSIIIGSFKYWLYKGKLARRKEESL